MTSSCQSVSSATIESYNLKLSWPSTYYSKLYFSYQNIWTYAIYHITANKINLIQQIDHSGTYVALSHLSHCDRRDILIDRIDKSFALHNNNSLINDFVSVNCKWFKLCLAYFSPCDISGKIGCDKRDIFPLRKSV